MKKTKHGVGVCALLAACLTFVGAGAVREHSDAYIDINEVSVQTSVKSTSKTESDTILCCAKHGSQTIENANSYLHLTSNSDTNDNTDNSPPCPQPRECDTVSALSENAKVSSRVLELLLGKDKKTEKKTVALGGDIFGIKLKGAYVTVKDAKGVPALSAGDIIHSINGVEIKSAKEAAEIISKSGGESITIKASRRGVPISLEIRPTKSDETYTLGLTLRDGAMGIGTMTFYDPETGLFGGLGHGICDSEGKAPIEIKSGEAMSALLGGVKKGECGKPGELSGIITGEYLGTITSNNDCGVYGYLDSPEAPTRLVEIGSKTALREGEATIVSTLKNGKTAEYKIKIYDINKSAQGSKCFRIKVTDETLIALTGGIVRGMSGSPIIQDGKLVGAVTHVMVADPTEGYGIFIENMLNAANIPMAKAS